MHTLVLNQMEMYPPAVNHRSVAASHYYCYWLCWRVSNWTEHI